MASDLDLSQTPNPYDFGNPVSRRELFSGREAELKDIRYYLNQAVRAPNPINLALLGPRASGKTSLLNMIALEAADRRFCVVRIDLNESDAETQLSFFFKLFDAVFAAACTTHIGGDAANEYAFGGVQGRIYECYVDLAFAYSVPTQREFAPLLFPIQFAKAMGAGNQSAHVSDTALRTDLRRIHDTLRIPVAILFDECNVLGKNRVLLEMMRNIFMNLPGYMLVFTGTEDLFPLMDDVFSPIIRQFKKIPVGHFGEIAETRGCIRRPLEQMKLEVDQLTDLSEGAGLHEIHTVTAGRPYEIQLLCHIMFRRVQEKRASRMTLDLGVLEEVRKELETSQSVDSRPILRRIRSLTKDELTDLATLAYWGPNVSVDHIISNSYVLMGIDTTRQNRLRALAAQLEEEGVFTSSARGLQFLGDEFDKTYTKYFAREQGVGLGFPDVPVPLLCGLLLELRLSSPWRNWASPLRRMRGVVPYRGPRFAGRAIG